jgi:two-component system phosphate regulon sensor histidine kinase PhoR
VHDQLLKVLESFAVVIEQRNGEVILSLDAPLDLIEADEVHLSGILRNLVDNAVKYSPDTLSLRFATFSTDNGICLTVEDQGSGIAKEQLERIFEKFYRVPTGNRHDVKGFGLGLSYVKEMVHRHKGKISVSSKPGKGSIFTIWFPQLTKS